MSKVICLSKYENELIKNMDTILSNKNLNNIPSSLEDIKKPDKEEFNNNNEIKIDDEELNVNDLRIQENLYNNLTPDKIIKKSDITKLEKAEEKLEKVEEKKEKLVKDMMIFTNNLKMNPEKYTKEYFEKMPYEELLQFQKDVSIGIDEKMKILVKNPEFISNFIITGSGIAENIFTNKLKG